jgi:hypothetical protein
VSVFLWGCQPPLLSMLNWNTRGVLKKSGTIYNSSELVVVHVHHHSKLFRLQKTFFFTKYCKRLENYCVVCCLFVLVICKKKFTCCFWNMEEVKLFSALASRTWCICKS